MSTTFDLGKTGTVKSLIEHLVEVTPNAYKAAAKTHADSFKYDGFNMTEILTNFLNCMKSERKIKDDAAFAEIVDIVNIGLTRGNIRVDQLGRTSKEGKERIEALVSKYKIPMRKVYGDKVVTGSGTITFTRAISIFPFVASMLINNNSVTIERIECKYHSNDLPDAMKHSGFMGLIPTNGEWGEVIFKAHLGYMVSFGRKISRVRKEEKDALLTQHTFSMAGWTNTSVYSNEVRVSALTKLGLLDEKYADAYLATANAVQKGLGFAEWKVDIMKKAIKDGLLVCAA